MKRMKSPIPLTLFRLAWTSFAALCFSRAVAYSSLFGNYHDSPGPMLLTEDGKTLWWFALIWALLGLALMVEVITGKLAGSLAFMGAFMVVWASTYVADWVFHDGHSPSLITGCYYGLAGIGLSFVCLAVSKVMRENRLLREENDKLKVSMAVTRPRKGRGDQVGNV